MFLKDGRSDSTCALCNVDCACAGTVKNHKDAASVRTTHPIPASCGVYYFEVKVVSKGRDGQVVVLLYLVELHFRNSINFEINRVSILKKYSESDMDFV